MVTAVNFHALIYPAWAILFDPSAAWCILPRTFLISGLVLAVVLRYCGIPNRAQIWKNTILRVCIVGFFADFLGALLGFGLYAFLLPVGFPWEQLTMLPGVAFAGAMLYLFHACISFGRCDLNREQLHTICLSLAVFTAPYTMLLPFDLF